MIDDSELSPVTLVVTFLNGRVERWGPAPRGFAELVMDNFSHHPPQEYVSCYIEEDAKEPKSQLTR